ncbi:MAG TPA: aminotransferase class I/II-fold pyridoxal phosphate-dependent enzyme [Aquihabitans sp.]|jgi:histidinol-phosphate/aromatic aminotransferase/cobyric acid decarboxylase-like protein|nr:aminotransferase class I/II-fold pyridoxal phosphate-dependent enzyme [Aquihabitans sp.]
MSATPTPRPAIDLPPPGAHGGDGARVAEALGIDVADVLDLSASLNPVAPDAAAIAAHHLGALRRYPDPTRATAVLAERLGVDPDRVLLTNGGAEAIALVGAEVGGTVDEPDFSLYPRTPAPGTTASGPAPRWRSNPHSPSGRLADPADVAGVWDEAFWPLATGTWTRGDHRTGAVVVGSLTKLLACPGLRLGYVLAPDGSKGDRLLAAVRAAQPGWSVGGLACEALPDLLDAVDLPAWTTEIARLRTELRTLLEAHRLRVEAADAPWVLVRDAGHLRTALAAHAVVVRDCASFGLPGTVRLAVPDDAGRARLAAALAAIA